MKYFPLLIILLLFGCKQQQRPNYTIKGRIINGTTNQPFANQSLSFGAKSGATSKSADLGTASTDNTGYFSITYPQTEVGNFPIVVLTASNFQLRIPANRNIDSTFYLSNLGKIKVFINIKTQITANDTLYLGIPFIQGNLVNIEVDTILNAKNGYYKTFILPPPSGTFHTGIGYKDFNYDPVYQKFRNPGHLISFNITGDPYIDSVTINY